MRDGILWRLRTGSPWRDLPAECGPRKTVYTHFDEWNSVGTVVRAARCAAGGGKKDPEELDDHASGQSRGGFSTRIDLVCDAGECPLPFELSAG